MKYLDTVPAVFLERKNRFVALVQTEGQILPVHVKNTGRLKELLQRGNPVMLQKAKDPSRKTGYDLISVRKDPLGWVNIDSQACNLVVREWLEGGNSCFPAITALKQEYAYGSSRMDFYLESDDRKILMEVKGCTLQIGGKGYFPDAPTQRGVRHLQELIKARQEGYEAYIAFVIAVPGAKAVYPNDRTQPEFGIVLEKAFQEGVEILYLTCRIGCDELTVTGWKQRRR